MQATIEISDCIRGKSPRGCQCFFVKLGNRGLKVYRTPEERDQAYSNQVWLHSKGLAPRAYFKGKVLIKDCAVGHGFEDRETYCYESELAEVFSWKYRKENDLSYEDYAKYVDRFEDASTEIKRKLRKLDIMWYDDGRCNVGFVDGQAVLIDTADDLVGDSHHLRK